MKNPEYRIDKDILYINIDGKIDATNAPEFEEKKNEVIKTSFNNFFPISYKFTNLVLQIKQ